MFSRWVLACSILTALAGCGSTDADRAASGGASNAVGGASSVAGGTAGGAAASGATGDSDASAPARSLGELGVERVATWRSDALGAYSIIHDDLCSWGTDGIQGIAQQELNARNLKAGAGAVVEACESRELWAELRAMAQSGHEIINHSWSHANLVDNRDYETEIDQARATLEAELGSAVTFFIFPFDAFDSIALDHLRSQAYLGARAGPRGVNPVDLADPLQSMFDVFGPDPSYSVYGNDMQAYADAAVATRGWALQELHGVADSSWGSVAADDYRAHLDYIKSRVDARDLWMDTPSAVVRYRLAREHCAVPAAEGSTVTFMAPSAECLNYATSLSVVITTTADTPRAVAFQDGAELSTSKLEERRFIIDIDPSAGPATISGAD